MSKVQNWSEEAVTVLTENYPTTPVEELAKQLGKTVPAVRSKLVNLGIYQKQEAVTKAGKAPAMRKLAAVKQIAETLGVEMEEVESLEKASKATLELLLKVLAEKSAE